jgi:hypothetical protein
MSPDAVSSLSFIDISGTPYEIGRALGRFGAAAVHEHLRQAPAWREVMSRHEDERIAAMAETVQARHPRYWAELQGLADGLGVPFEEIWLWNCRGDIWAMAPDGCTTVQIPGEHRLVAHNEDGDPGLKGACAIARISSRGGRTFSAFVYPGSLPGHTFAVTELGLVQTVNNIRSCEAGAGVPRMVLTRAALDAASLDEAASLVRAAPRAGGFHLTLAQAGDPRLLSVEFTASRCSVEEVRKPSIHANHLIHEDMASLPQVITDSSGSRQQRGDRQIRAGGEVDPLAILWDAADAQLPIHRTDPADPDLENTLATVRFSIGTDRVEWSVYDDRKRLTGFANCRVLVPAAA